MSNIEERVKKLICEQLIEFCGKYTAAKDISDNLVAGPDAVDGSESATSEGLP